MAFLFYQIRSYMTQRRSRRTSSTSPSSNHSLSQPASKTRQHTRKPLREQTVQAWNELHTSKHSSSASYHLTQLIQQDAPLKTHSGLVLMYGPFQAEMQPEAGQGVASWLTECVRKHGLPSLVRYDYRYRAQIFRRDQFQPWLEPLLSSLPS